MIEIGASKLATVKVRDKRSGRLVEKLGPDGKPEQRLRTKDVWRVTRTTLGGCFGRDRLRKLVVGLVAGDQIVFRPQGTRQEIRINVTDAYRIALQRKAAVASLERARQRKEIKAARLAAARIARAERRLTAAAKRDTAKYAKT